MNHYAPVTDVIVREFAETSSFFSYLCIITESVSLVEVQAELNIFQDIVQQRQVTTDAASLPTT